MIRERYLRLPSDHLGRPVHLWTFGHWGAPVIAFPSAAGMAHEWRAGGAIEALRPLIVAGRIKLYCPESNVSETWMGEAAPPGARVDRHDSYERFVLDELVPWVRDDCHQPRARIGVCGASFGAFYAANFTLKQPETFPWALCLSGRYDSGTYLDGLSDLRAYYNQPLSYVPNLAGAELERVRRQAHLTLVVGQGAYEGRCVAETQRLAAALASRGIPHHLDVWGHDVSHEWVWWQRQLRWHFGQRFAA